MPKPSRRRLSSDERRLGIVNAVLALAGEHGPDAVTTQAIADRIGVTQGALFRHFPDKEAMWLAVFDWVRTALDAAVDAAIDPEAPPLANLERAFCAHVGLVAAHPGVPRALYHELQTVGDSRVRAAVRAMVGDYRRRLLRLFEQAKVAGELPLQLDAALATVLFIGAVQGLVIQAALAGGSASLEKRAQPMFALLLDGYRGGRGRPRRATRAATRTSPAVPRATRRSRDAG
ncbi:MAG TPA: TetR/AcrR family transcriptional regulator [Casimicrobiaceae bacterium]|nr:TetR/AcrR family transcriptional regulator [Casimicrobiaceae bacterium]